MKCYNLLSSSLALYALSCAVSLNCSIAYDTSLADFQGMLFSEINSEIEQAAIVLQEESSRSAPQLQSGKHQGRFLQEQDVLPSAQDLWNKVIQHGWDLSLANSKSIQKRILKEAQGDIRPKGFFPYIVCSHSSRTKSAFQRLKPMLEYTEAYLDDAIVVLNESKKTCYHVSLKYDRARRIKESQQQPTSKSDGDHYSIMPMTDLMKIQFDTMKLIHKDSWAVPSGAPNSNDWERIIRIGLTSGHRIVNTDDKNEVYFIAKRVLNDIRLLGESGHKNRQRRKLQKETLSELSEMSLASMFSITAAASKPNKEVEELRYLRQGSYAYLEKPEEKNRWIRSLELGLEADHTCNDMFDSLNVKVHNDNQGFDIVLNPRIRQSKNHNHGVEIEDRNTSSKEAVKDSKDRFEGETNEKSKGSQKRHESSASNMHCVVSLIIALSTHPLVLSVESEGPVESSDYESQWITESKSQINRPLRDLGINGKGQVISIIDSGLDINHEYFGPTNAKVFRVSYQQVEFKLLQFLHLFLIVSFCFWLGMGSFST